MEQKPKSPFCILQCVNWGGFLLTPRHVCDVYVVWVCNLWGCVWGFLYMCAQMHWGEYVVCLWSQCQMSEGMCVFSVVCWLCAVCMYVWGFLRPQTQAWTPTTSWSVSAHNTVTQHQTPATILQHRLLRARRRSWKFWLLLWMILGAFPQNPLWSV